MNIHQAVMNKEILITFMKKQRNKISKGKNLISIKTRMNYEIH